MDSAQAMAGLRAAVAAFHQRDQAGLTTDARGEELAELRRLMDALELEFSSSARAFQVQGGHWAQGTPSAVSWLRHNCNMSSSAAADRLCVGKELESLPRVAEALAVGEIGWLSVDFGALPPAQPAGREARALRRRPHAGAGQAA